MSYTHLISDCCLTIPLSRQSRHVYGNYSEAITEDPQAFTWAANYYFCQMLTTGSWSIRMPIVGTGFSSQGVSSFKKLLPPTTRKRVKFIDRRHWIWDAILQYVLPIRKDIGPTVSMERRHWDTLDQLCWEIYRLILSSRWQSQAIIKVDDLLKALKWLATFELSFESRARVASLSGILASFVKKEQIPGLTCLPGSESLITERIEEILEDGYLLEVNRIRRFLSIRANVAAIKRDLRHLTRHIVKTRHWAKGLVRVVSNVLTLSSSGVAVVDSLQDLLGKEIRSAIPPILLDSIHKFIPKEDFLVVANPGGVTTYFPRRAGFTISNQEFDNLYVGPPYPSEEEIESYEKDFKEECLKKSGPDHHS